MNIKSEIKKRYKDTINQCLDNAINTHGGNFKEIGYKEMIQSITDNHGVTTYEVLNYFKELEYEGSIRFYQTKNIEKGNIGIVSETYRLKIEEVFKVASGDYLTDFINEALILDLVK